jgi:uncharacterized membrane protein YdjX (TVP38/TMEM64 family)
MSDTAPETPPTTTQPATLFRRLGAAGPLAILSGTLPPLGGFVLIGSIGKIAPFLRTHQTTGLLLYIAGFSTLAALALLPTYACSVLGGWTFGFAIGFPASMTAFCGASLLAYLINRRAAGHRVLVIIHEHPKWEAVITSLLGCGFWRALWIIILLRLPPISPFAAMNFIMGATRAPLGAFLLGTAIGMAPRTGAVVWAAAHASTLDFKLASTQTWLYLAGVLATLAAVTTIGHIATKAVHRATAGAATQAP